MEFTGPKLVVSLFICLLIGSTGGYLITSNNYVAQIQDKEEIILSLNQELDVRNQSISDLSQTVNEQEIIIDQKTENITTLYSELSDLIASIENEPDIIAEKEDEIIELEQEIKDQKFEIIALKERLGERLNWKTYSAHDFSFEYPEYMELSKIDNGYYGGELLYRSYLDPVSYFGFIWIDTATLIEEAAEEVTEDIENTLFEEMIIVESEINGHTSYIYHYTVRVGDGEYHGIMCIWACENTGRTMALLHFSSEDPMSLFFECLGTIKCHREGTVT